MPSIFARCIGLTPDQQIPMDAAIVYIERQTLLSRAEARVVMLDYLGWPREDLCDQLGVSIETVRTYWKRIYRKTNCRSRTDIRSWLESVLEQGIAGGAFS